MRTTSIHVRRGDYVNHPSHHPTQSIEYYKQGIEILNSETDLFVIFSDDIQWCKDNTHNIITTKKGLTDYAVAIQPESKCRNVPGFDSMTTVEQYKQFIIHDKEFATWTGRKMPSWYQSSASILEPAMFS